MIRRRHTPEQIIRALREAEVGLANGKTVGMSLLQQTRMRISRTEQVSHQIEGKCGIEPDRNILTQVVKSLDQARFGGQV